MRGSILRARKAHRYGASMRWIGRRLTGRGAGSGRGARSASVEDLVHLEEFARSRKGVEAYVEPRTAVTETTVMLVASSGEWTRRRVDGPEGAAALAKRLGIPVYDAGV